MRPRYADLFRKMQDPDPSRQDAAFDAVLFDRAEAVPDLIECYRSEPETLLRYFVVQLMGFSGSEDAVSTLVFALDDPSPEVRAEACRSLEDLRARAAVDALTARLDDVNGGVRDAARDALSAMGR